MKKIFISLIALSSIFLSSQEIDDLFLESLPEDVREDVLDKVEAKEKSEEPIYRRASVELDKKMSQSNEEDEFVEDYDYSDKVFGKKFFDTIQSSFMPVNEPNLDDSYILDYGDVLEIQLFGQEEFTEEYSINRDGSINITRIGKVNVGGLKLSDANDLIKAKVNSSYIGTEAYITLSNVRDIQVLVTGNAFNPGVYTLSGNSNMLHALTMAGGIDDNGSYREIKLIRDNKVIENLDIYELIILGKNNINTRLRTGDSILVSPALNIVNVLSGVNRPFIYELKKDETLNDLVIYANGISSDADLDFIQLQRLDKNEVQIVSLKYEDLNEYVAKNNDSLIIREYKYGTVEVSGAVKIPGKYKIIDDADFPSDREFQDAWDDVLKRLAHHHGKAAIRSWFSNTVITKAEDTPDGVMLTLECPREFVRGWIEKHFFADMNHYWQECDYGSRPVIGTQLQTKEAAS